MADGAPLGPIADAAKRELCTRIRAKQRQPARDVLIITAVTDPDLGADARPGETTYEFAVPHT
ncbi:MAG: hypothetical protein JOZ99_10275 [Actinobacteria bacterium]|nr:hypothetical protein [Actinomycetota bacterium]